MELNLALVDALKVVLMKLFDVCRKLWVTIATRIDHQDSKNFIVHGHQGRKFLLIKLLLFFAPHSDILKNIILTI